MHLRESSFAPSSLRVDREAGIIFGVKVLGSESPNTHGKSGVKGTIYKPSAHESLVSLIESCGTRGMKVNKNHTERSNPNRDRTVEERLGWLLNPVARDAETFADLHVLKSDPDSAKLFEAAERNPSCFALSINADGHYQIVDSFIVVDKFKKVWSVDTVADGGSTISLAESRKPAMTLKESLAVIGFKEAEIKKMCEGDTLLKPDMAVDEQPAAGGDINDPDYCAHLGRAILAIVNDPEIPPDQKKKKILAILKIQGDEEEDEEETELEESDEEEGKPPMKKKKDGDDEEEKVKESLERLDRLEKRDQVRTLCESLEYQPAKDAAAEIIDAIAALPTKEARIKLIETLRGQKAAAKHGTGPPRSGTTRVTESAAPAMPKDAAEQAKLLRRS